MDIIERARAYERDYHENIYGSHGLFEPGTWLYKPAAYATKSFDLVQKHNDVRVLDLGGGVGRHSIPAAQHFGESSKIVCVDLLASAIEKLSQNAERLGVANRVAGIAADVEILELSEPQDLILSISCIEHVPTKQRLEKLIERLQTATTPKGIHCFMMITNNEWIDSTNDKKLTPLIEQNLTSKETIDMLEILYSDWKIHDLSTKDWQATQLMGGKEVILKSTCVQFTAQKAA
jgi:cyclopropane fatty-acyl-phospholipid synthase-like methyltransferase